MRVGRGRRLAHRLNAWVDLALRDRPSLPGGTLLATLLLFPVVGVVLRLFSGWPVVVDAATGLSWIDVRDYGALPTKADNGPQWQNAITAGGSGSFVLYAPGTYPYKTPIALTSKTAVTILGDGSSRTGAITIGSGLRWTGGIPATDSQGVLSFFDASGCNNLSVQHFNFSVAAVTVTGAYQLDLGNNASGFYTFDVFFGAGSTTGLTGHVKVAGVQGEGTFQLTEFSGNPASIPWGIDNDTTNIMNGVKVVDCFTTGARLAHNPGTAWVFSWTITEQLTTEPLMSIVTCDTGYTGCNGLSVYGMSPVDQSAAGDTAWFQLTGTGHNFYGGRVQLSNGTSLVKAVDNMGTVGIFGLAVFATGASNHILDLNSKTVANFNMFGWGLISGSTLGTVFVNGTPTSFFYVDVNGVPQSSTAVVAADIGAVQQVDVTGPLTTTSATYTDISATTPTVTATIGASGKAFVTVMAGLTTSVAGNTVFVSFSVDGGAPSDANALTAALTGGDMLSKRTLVTGLSVGAHTFDMQVKSDGTRTATLNRARILVEPV